MFWFYLYIHVLIIRTSSSVVPVLGVCYPCLHYNLFCGLWLGWGCRFGLWLRICGSSYPPCGLPAPYFVRSYVRYCIRLFCCMPTQFHPCRLPPPWSAFIPPPSSNKRLVSSIYTLFIFFCIMIVVLRELSRKLFCILRQLSMLANCELDHYHLTFLSWNHSQIPSSKYCYWMHWINRI